MDALLHKFWKQAPSILTWCCVVPVEHCTIANGMVLRASTLNRKSLQYVVPTPCAQVRSVKPTLHFNYTNGILGVSPARVLSRVSSLEKILSNGMTRHL